MTAKTDGGAAFPVPLNPGESYTQHGPADGMTLRDYFAAKAMKGLLANPGGPLQSNGISGWGWRNCTLEDVVSLTYTLADAMLAQRER